MIIIYRSECLMLIGEFFSAAFLMFAVGLVEKKVDFKSGELALITSRGTPA